MKKTALILSVILMGMFFQACDKKTETQDKPSIKKPVMIGEVGNFETRDYTAVVSMSGFPEAASIGDITVEYDAEQKATRVSSTQGEMAMDAIETPEFAYMKMGENWTKIPINQEDRQEDPGMMTQEAINGWMSEPGVKALGEEDCGDQKCKVYEQAIGGTTTKVYIEKKENLPHTILSAMETGGMTKIVYDFSQQVELTIPEVDENAGMPMMFPPGMEGQGIDEAELEKMMQDLESSMEQ